MFRQERYAYVLHEWEESRFPGGFYDLFFGGLGIEAKESEERTILGVGAGTVISVAFGAGDTEKAKNTAGLCFYAGNVLSAIISVLLLAFSAPLLRFLGTQPEMWDDAATYLRVLAPGTVAFLGCYSE